jgi:hypothetical protein
MKKSKIWSNLKGLWSFRLLGVQIVCSVGWFFTFMKNLWFQFSFKKKIFFKIKKIRIAFGSSSGPHSTRKWNLEFGSTYGFPKMKSHHWLPFWKSEVALIWFLLTWIRTGHYFSFCFSKTCILILFAGLVLWYKKIWLWFQFQFGGFENQSWCWSSSD